MIRSGRRRFLAGLGGFLVALPFLEGLEPKAAADTTDRRFFLNFHQWFGVQQRPRFRGKYKDETEGFWPDAPIGPNGSVALTKALLQKATNGEIRATGELADFASSLLMLRGVRLMDLDDLHQPHLVQVMTGSHNIGLPNTAPHDDHSAWPMHETLDSLIARTIDGSQPLVFEALVPGSKTSFKNGQNGGIPEQNATYQHPSDAYTKLFKQQQTDAGAVALRGRATDAVLAELKSLRADKRLSSEDRHRLDAHFDAMSTVETKLQCMPTDFNTDPALQSIKDADLLKTTDSSKQRWEASGIFNEYADTVADAFIHIAALGVSCGAFRSANLIMPAATNFNHASVFAEGTPEWEQGFPGQYHALSHRAFTTGETDNADFTELEKGAMAHHAIDRWHARKFAKLLGLLRDAGVLDQGLTVWSNENGTGNHFAYDMPYIVAGSAAGKLKTGQFLDLQSEDIQIMDTPQDTSIEFAATIAAAMKAQTPCSKVLNTLGAALGLTSADKSPLSDFGGYQTDLPRITGNLGSLLT
jgi:hypothetical protein